jgi:hypothetical protein
VIADKRSMSETTWRVPVPAGHMMPFGRIMAFETSIKPSDVPRAESHPFLPDSSTSE